MEIVSVEIFVDSQLLVNQIKGTYAAKQPTIREYLQKTKEALKSFDSYTIEHIQRNQNKKVNALSKLASLTFEHLTKEVLIKVLAKRSIEEKEILQVETKEEESWMTPIHEYLVSGLLPEDPKEARKIRVKAPPYKLIRGSLYQRSFYTSWLCCVAPPQTNDIVKEIHEGSRGFNTEPRSMVEQSVIRKAAENDAIAAGNGWSFSHWGVNILGPLPTAPGGFKFLAIAIEHSTKWVEAKPLTTISERHTERHIRGSLKRIESNAILLPCYRAHGNNEPYRKAIDSKPTRIAKNTLAKDDKRRTKEVTKKKEGKEVASIEEAYYQNKLSRYHNERSSHSTYKIGDFVLLSQSDTGNPQVWQGPHMISEVREGEFYKIIDASDHSLIQTAKGASLHKFYM
ncbi:reverse transcriptase domain-containing protein [Tanacetum coccineum]